MRVEGRRTWQVGEPVEKAGVCSFLLQEGVDYPNQPSPCRLLTLPSLPPLSSFQGNDLEKVSQSAARVHQAALIHNKDIRKFLDGAFRGGGPGC